MIGNYEHKSNPKIRITVSSVIYKKRSGTRYRSSSHRFTNQGEEKYVGTSIDRIVLINNFRRI